jgi:putative PIN family toxin of toxin-antitoxin system
LFTSIGELELLRVVLDTNILISGIFWRGNPYKILSRCLGEGLQLVTSLEILEELQQVLRTEKKFGLNEEDISSYIGLMISNSIMVNPAQAIDVVTDDPEDNAILECAVEGKADYIISGDRHLLSLREYGGIRILTAREFIEFINNE